MHIPIPHNLRASFAFSIILIFAAIWLIKKNSGSKNDYSHVTGKLTYLSKRLGHLPNRDLGMYRYFKIENYAYPFEVYADEQGARMDSLKTGELVTAYFYETDNTHEEQVNRFLQFLQKDNKMYFTQRVFNKQIGYVLILLAIVFAYFCYLAYTSGKIEY